jgi:glycosyltransferase involved in cell wall biosynthesis
VLPTYNEKDSIEKIIKDYYNTGYVDEVVVINNNAAAGTKEAVEKTRARQIFEKKQGYGFAIRRGFDEAKGDLIVIAEPDGTFRASDLIKLLAYSDDYDMVWGTRTDIRFIEKGANMKMALRLGNLFVAKMLQFLFNTTRLSDVGCTLKLYKREAIDIIKKHFKIGREHFGVELMVLSALEGFNIVEIPVHYDKRVGRSSVTGHLDKTFVLAIQMMGTIAYYFITRGIFQTKRSGRKAGSGHNPH